MNLIPTKRPPLIAVLLLVFLAAVVSRTTYLDVYAQPSPVGPQVRKIIAGSNITISPSDGTGNVTINSTGGGGSGNVTNNGTLTANRIVVGGGTTVVTVSGVGLSASGRDISTVDSITATTNTTLTLATLDNNKNVVIAPHGTGGLQIPVGVGSGASTPGLVFAGNPSAGLLLDSGTVYISGTGGYPGWGVNASGSLVPYFDNTVGNYDVGTSAKRPRGVWVGDGSISVKSGANAHAGTFTLSSGTATVSNTGITANSVVCPTVKTSSGTLGTGTPEIVITAGVGFTATGVATDNSTYNFVVFEVN